MIRLPAAAERWRSVALPLEAVRPPRLNARLGLATVSIIAGCCDESELTHLPERGAREKTVWSNHGEQGYP